MAARQLHAPGVEGVLPNMSLTTKTKKRRSRMFQSLSIWALIGAVGFAGCASQAQFLDNKQAMAMQTAVSRGQFEMNCPQVTPTLISREVIQPALQGPLVNGIQRAEYTVGVQGCGKRTMFVVICPDGGEGCFGAGPGPFHDWR
jgi:hypothetical protein